jgi:DNA-binding NarL/FixJ family response regulator
MGSENVRPAGVLILDGHPIAAEGLAAILAGDPESFEVAGTAATVEEFIDLVEARPVDLAVVEFDTLPEGVAAVRTVCRRFPDLKVLVLTASEDAGHAHEAMHAGASAYLLKRTPVQTLLSALRLIGEGEVVIGPRLVYRLLREPMEDGVVLSDEHLKVLRLVAEGVDLPELGTRLAMSESTARRRLREVQERLGAHNRIEAAVRAAKLGLI